MKHNMKRNQSKENNKLLFELEKVKPSSQELVREGEKKVEQGGCGQVQPVQKGFI